jgi:hypothetical protein
MQVVAVNIRWWAVSTTTWCKRIRSGQRPTAVRMAASTEGRMKQDLLYAQFMHGTDTCVRFAKRIVSVIAFSLMDIHITYIGHQQTFKLHGFKQFGKKYPNKFRKAISA